MKTPIRNDMMMEAWGSWMRASHLADSNDKVQLRDESGTVVMWHASLIPEEK